MSFEPLNSTTSLSIHSRKAIILYHFTKEEQRKLQTIGKLIGVSDYILVNQNQSHLTLRALLDGNQESSKEMGPIQKLIVFNNVPHSRITAFLEARKKLRMPRPFTAVVTENSIDWSIETLISHLIEERQALESGQGSIHL